MNFKFLSAKNAAALDKDLMSTVGAFSIDQLMELAGLSVSQAGNSSFTATYHQYGILKSFQSTACTLPAKLEEF